MAALYERKEELSSDTMIDVIMGLKQHFDDLQDRLQCFAALGFQGEGWFKGELLTRLVQLQENGSIDDFAREVRVSSGRIDVVVNLNGVRHWIELKNWLIGVQQGTTYGPSFYFSDPTSVGITKDVDKLRALEALEPPHRRWLLLLLTANPGVAPWEAGIAKFNAKFAPRQLVPRTHPDQFPQTYFLGLLEVAQRDASVAP